MCGESRGVVLAYLPHKMQRSDWSDYLVSSGSCPVATHRPSPIIREIFLWLWA